MRPIIARIADPETAVFDGTGSIGLYRFDVSVAGAYARAAYYDDDPVRTKLA